MTIKELFDTQIRLQDILGLEVKDDPIQFYYAIAGIHEEAEEAKREDSRWKECILGMPGYKHSVNKRNKTAELADVFTYIMIACIYSGISAEEFTQAVYTKLNQKNKKFIKMKGEH